MNEREYPEVSPLTEMSDIWQEYSSGLLDYDDLPTEIQDEMYYYDLMNRDD